MTRPRAPGQVRMPDNDLESEGLMATAQECRAALEDLTARISEMDAKHRAAHLADRTLSCRVTDLDVTFVTRLGPDGAGEVAEAPAGAPPAQIRFTAASDEVLAIAADPGSFARAWLTGRLKVEGNMLDLLRLRRLL
ncbi:MAG: SCP2 sterol-binding domain-containing protein [Streptosporangiaceae bacterium]